MNGLRRTTALVPAGIRRFFRNRFFEVTGSALLAGSAATAAAVSTWSVDDPSFNNAVDGAAQNLLGYPGAVLADGLMQYLGLGVIAAIAIPVAWSARLISHEPLAHPVKQPLAWLAAILCASGMLAFIPVPPTWALTAGLGGNMGDILSGAALTVLSIAFKGFFASLVSGLLFATLLAWTALYAAGLTRREAIWVSRLFGERVSNGFANSLGAISHLWMSLKARAQIRRETKILREPVMKAPRKRAAPVVDEGEDGLGLPPPPELRSPRTEPRLLDAKARQKAEALLRAQSAEDGEVLDDADAVRCRRRGDARRLRPRDPCQAGPEGHEGRGQEPCAPFRPMPSPKTSRCRR